MFAAASPTLAGWSCGYGRYRSQVGSPSSVGLPHVPRRSRRFRSVSAVRRCRPPEVGRRSDPAPSSHWLASASFTTATGRVAAGVEFRERAAMFQRNARGFEVSRRHHAVLRDRHALPFDGPSVDRERHTGEESAQRQDRDRRPSASRSAETTRVQPGPAGRRRSTLELLKRLAGKERRADRTPVGIESRGDRLNVREALREHRHHDQQHDRDRDLGADQQTAHASAPPAVVPRPLPCSASRTSTAAEAERGNDAKQHAGDEDTAIENSQHRDVDADLADPRQSDSAPAPGDRPRPTTRAATPRKPPETLTSIASTRTSRTTFARDDPDASCSAISLRRLAARMSIRFARFAQAMSRTAPTAANTVQSEA